MARMKLTSDGTVVPFTAEEEAAQDEVEAATAAASTPENLAKAELAQLDAVLPRWAEDLMGATDTQPFPGSTTAATLARKVELRAIINPPSTEGA